MKPPRTRAGSRAPGEYSRHYHRSDSATKTTWNEWIDNGAPRGNRPWLKIALVVAAILLLGAIMIGLIIEMRPT